MQSLTLPQRYHTIIIPCGSFTLITDFELARATLKNFYEHLVEDGELVFNIFMTDYDYSESNPPTLPEENWRFHFEVPRPNDGANLKIYRRQVGVDAWEQISREERRYELWVNGELQQEEVHQGAERWYFRHELQLMMEQAGFQEVQVARGYHDGEPSYVMIVRGRKR